MRRVRWLAVLGLAALAATSSQAWAQPRPYIGYVYPAGGQQGTTVHIRLGGQGLDGIDSAIISGPGVQARLVEYYRRLTNEEVTMLSEQARELRKSLTPTPKINRASIKAATQKTEISPKDEAAMRFIDRIEKRMTERVQTPACASISNLVFLDVTIAPDAPPGAREIRLVTPRGVSNPLVFHVGQVPEHSRKAMISATIQTLGKEEAALRKRPPEEAEANVVLPCTLNGQIASGEMNRYRFEAKKGQHLLFSVNARQLIPFIADAVPGWFQPVLTLYDANGKEVAYNDDYRFKPDPLIYYEVPANGQYVLCITDAIFRGREDFIYRITAGELPFVTSIFPLGGPAGKTTKIECQGWNLGKAQITPPPKDAKPGTCRVCVTRDGMVSNSLPFALDTLPETLEIEPNYGLANAQKVTLPIIINGRIDRPDDVDVFQFAGHAGDTIVAEVNARRLESPLDSVLKLTDSKGTALAVNDDHEDPQAGVNTHDADSYLMFKLPADGTYYVHLSDAARHGGPEYAYRLRISEPQPDFSLLAVPSSAGLRSKQNSIIRIQAIRKDGYAGPIILSLKNPPEGFSASPITIPANQSSVGFSLRTSLMSTTQPTSIVIEGHAKMKDKEISHDAVAVEDRMQAFLWRHLVPAQDLKVVVSNPAYDPPTRKSLKKSASAPASAPAVASTKPATSSAIASTQPTTGPATATPGKFKFTKSQVARRLQEIKSLFEEGLITEEFANRKIAECEEAQ